jgi:chromosome segregation ATPase
MVCSMVKKGLIAAALGAGTLFLVFGTSAPSYVKTAFFKIRQNAKDAVPPQFDIDRAKADIASLQPAFDQNKETLARAEVEAEHLDREITTLQAYLDQQKTVIQAMHAKLKSGDFRLTGHVADTADEVKAELAHRYDNYRYNAELLGEKQATLKAKRTIIKAAKEQLQNLKTQKATLLAKLANIEAKLRLLEASQIKNDFNFDGSALANAKKTVSELEQRLEVMVRKAEYDVRYGDLSTPSTFVDPDRDIVKEIDEAFGQGGSRPAAKAGDKSL